MKRTLHAAVAAVFLMTMAAGSASAALAPTGSEAPNVVVIMLDDMPGGAAQRLFERMPRIKALFLDRGISLPELYANDPLCCPGRASFLTGLYSHEHGVIRNDASLFDPRETLATALDREGYFTILSGKYLNGADSLGDKTPPGWDRVAMTDQGYTPTWWVNGANDGVRGYGPKVAGDYALRFLQEAPPTAPAFLYLSFYAVHSARGPATADGYSLPNAGPYDDEDYRCLGVGSYRTPAFNEADVSDKPAFIRGLPLWQKPYPLSRACEALQTVDDSVDLVYRELVAQGRLQNTLWLVIADNGMTWGDHRDFGKSSAYSTHLPGYVRWPARWGGAARRVSAHASMVDLAPTIAQAADAHLGPFPTGQDGPDGESILSLLDGGGPPDREALLEEHHAGLDWRAARTTDGRWHFVQWADGFVELYDLADDPYELENVASVPRLRRTVRHLEMLLDDLAT